MRRSLYLAAKSISNFIPRKHHPSHPYLCHLPDVLIECPTHARQEAGAVRAQKGFCPPAFMEGFYTLLRSWARSVGGGSVGSEASGCAWVAQALGLGSGSLPSDA